MLVEEVNIDSFRSFVDRTTIKLAPGITFIQGKQVEHIFQAVRWVMGESNLYSLGVRKNEDLLFSGTPLCKALNYNGVSIRIDNTAQRLPITDSQISIKRRYFRNKGISEYYFQYSPCRLTDISEFFNQAGIAKGGLSFVGPEQLDAIGNLGAVALRDVIHWTLGLGSEKIRILELENKLAKNISYLQRVSPLVENLNEQLQSDQSLVDLLNVRERLFFLKDQEKDIQKEIDKLQQEMVELYQTIATRMHETFDNIQQLFTKEYRQWVGGGQASLTYSDPESLATTGVEMGIAPLLEGKPTIIERRYAALALLCTMLRVHTVPFCMLYGMESILDADGQARLMECIQERSAFTQFLVLSKEIDQIEGLQAAMHYQLVDDQGISRLDPYSKELEE